MTWLVLIQHGRESGLDLYKVEMDGPDLLVLSGQLGADSLHIGQERPDGDCSPDWRRKKKKVELVILKKRGFLSLLSYIWTNELEFDFCFF